MSVCNNQNDFNMAIHGAVKYNQKQMIKESKPWVVVYIVLWFIFFIWAILLAMQVPAGNDRIEHLMFAVLFSPLYVVAHYLGAWKASHMEGIGMTASFGMGGGGCSSCGGCGSY